MRWLDRFRKDAPQPGAELGSTEAALNPADEGAERPTGPSPYLDARKTLASLAGVNVSSRYMWQMVAIVALLVAIAAVAGNVYQSMRSTMVPYVIQVDKLGATAAVGAATYAGDSDPMVIQAFLAAWVANARMVTPDTSLQRQAIYKVYALLGPNDTATKKMNAFYGRDGEGDPFSRAGKEAVEVQIETALPLTKESWQVDWVETTRDRQGARRTSTSRMRATLQVYQMPRDRRTTEEQMRLNPLGIYIKDFTWAKQLDPLPGANR